MEDKQLNFGRPLLSVRRRPSLAVTSKKDVERKPENSLRNIPQPPPYRSELKSGPIRNAGSVPFLWEHIPGRPKEETKQRTQNSDVPVMAPKPPPGRSQKANQTVFPQNFQNANENKSKIVSVPPDRHSYPSGEKNVKIPVSSKEKPEESETSDSDNSDEEYVDAVDTLSRDESFFINCSMSGLSAMDDLDSKPSGSSSMDIRTREFMMDRFLPAAKAMSSVAPEYAPKKQSFLEQTQVNKKADQAKPSLRYGPSFANRYSHYNNEDEEEESDDDSDQGGNLPGVCGLLPRFCLRSSVGLLNPVPAISVRSRAPMTSANKPQSKCSSNGYRGTGENELKSDISDLRPVNNIRAAEVEEKTSLRNDRGQNHNTSTYSDAPPMPFHESKHASRLPEDNNSSGSDGKSCITFQELLDYPGISEELDSGDLAFEKTVYVDTVRKVESAKSKSCSPEMQDIEEAPGSIENDCDTTIKKMDQQHIKGLSLEDHKKNNAANGDNRLLAYAQEYADFNIDKADKGWASEMQKAFGGEQDCNIASTTTENKVAEEKATRSIEKQLVRATPRNSHIKHSEFPVPPPLPKSPSDSWLGRTLPSISAKNVSPCSYFGALTNSKNQISKAPGDLKWETIVKSTNEGRRNLLYCQEPLTPIPET